MIFLILFSWMGSWYNTENCDMNPAYRGIVVVKSQVSDDGLGLYAHNNMSIIEHALWTFNNNQYITYVDSAGYVIVGKRQLPNGAWNLSNTGDTINDATDLHDIVSMGIDSDGYIHISYGMHAEALKYMRSDNPEDPSAFSNQSMTGANENSVTYPRFFMANDILFYSYRNGNWITGHQYLNKYNVATQTWSALHHKFIDGGIYSVYCDNFAIDNNGYIHTSFMWRVSSSPITSSDYSYAYSDDNGTTWKKTNGSSYSMPITKATAEKFDAGNDSTLVNQNRIDVDGNGYPHIAYWKAAPDSFVNYHHAWYNGAAWQITRVTDYIDTPKKVTTPNVLAFGRPGILIKRSNNLAYIFTRHGADSILEVFCSNSPYTNWKKTDLGNDMWGWQEFGGVDYYEWHNSDMFYLMATRASAGNPADIYILKSILRW